MWGRHFIVKRQNSRKVSQKSDLHKVSFPTNSTRRLLAFFSFSSFFKSVQHLRHLRTDGKGPEQRRYGRDRPEGRHLAA